jgi:phosphoribosyl-ATP pyrophosphohydrolase
MNSDGILTRLFDVIEERKRLRPDGSYVVQLLDGGVPAIAAKIREEADEVVEAGGEHDAAHLAHEVADLLFHTWLLMAHEGVAPSDVYAVLEARFGTGGLVEKAGRVAAASEDGTAASGGDAGAPRRKDAR